MKGNRAGGGKGGSTKEMEDSEKQRSKTTSKVQPTTIGMGIRIFKITPTDIGML